MCHSTSPIHNKSNKQYCTINNQKQTMTGTTTTRRRQRKLPQSVVYLVTAAATWTISAGGSSSNNCWVQALAHQLEPAAPRPSTHHVTASSIPDPPPIVGDPFEPSLVDHVLLAAFRWTLQQQAGDGCPRSDRPGFEGMVQELLDFRRIYGLDEQERVSYQTLRALAGPVPWIYRHLFAAQDFSPAVLAWFAKHLLPFLVGDMILTERGDSAAVDVVNDDDDRETPPSLPGGVLVHRCLVLEGTNCKGVCTKMCKLPTQRFFAEEWGVPLTMTPNFETGQCQLAFGVAPLAVADDPTIPDGCLTRCPAAAAVMLSQHQQSSSQQQPLLDDGC